MPIHQHETPRELLDSELFYFLTWRLRLRACGNDLNRPPWRPQNFTSIPGTKISLYHLKGALAALQVYVANAFVAPSLAWPLPKPLAKWGKLFNLQ